MIRRVRYQVITVVVALLTLAVGVALGAGPLGEPDEARGVDAAEASTPSDADGQAAVGERLVGDLARADVAGGLEGRRVAILAMPGADTDVVKSAGAWIRVAGGSVTGTYSATPKLVSTDSKSLVDMLGEQLAEPAGDSIPAEAATYERMGRVIGTAIATRVNPARSASPMDAGSSDILGGLDGAGLLTTKDQPTQRADLVLVILGTDRSPADDTVTDKIYAPLLTGIDATARGTVIAGDSASADDGTLRGLRADGALGPRTSTTDSVELTSGRVIAIKALAANAAGTFGAFGALGTDGLLPDSN